MKTINKLCELLPWDTEFFDFRIGKVNTNHINASNIEVIFQWCNDNQIECLYFLTDAQDQEAIRTAELNGFKLVQIRITFERHLSEGSNYAEAATQGIYQIRQATLDDVNLLGEIGRNIFTLARFYRDTCFPVEKSQKLYETWTKKSVLGYADQVLVLEKDSNIFGFVTLRIDSEADTGTIELIGLRTESQGQHLGRKLMLAALDWFATQKITKVLITTHGQNIPMQRVVQRMGFITSSIELYYHKWFTYCNNE